jgi:hypothetical protein
MPRYQVEIPGRGKFTVESPTELTDEQAYAAVLQDIGNAPPPKKGLMAALGKGAESALSQTRTGVAGAFGSAEEAARAGLGRGEELSDKYAEQIGTEKVKEAYTKDGVIAAAKEVGRQIPLAIAQQAPNIALGAAGARVGAMAGAPFGPVGSLIGGGLGAAAAFYPMVAGSHVEAQAREQIARGEPVTIDKAAAYGSAVPSAGIEALQQAIPIGGRLIRKLV